MQQWSCSCGNHHALAHIRRKGNIAFDGDTASFIGVYTDAKEDIIAYLNSKQGFVDPIGGIRTSTSVDTAMWFVRSFTGDPQE